MTRSPNRAQTADVAGGWSSSGTAMSDWTRPLSPRARHPKDVNTDSSNTRKEQRMQLGKGTRRMNIRKFAAVSFVAIAATGIASGTAYAAPEPQGQPDGTVMSADLAPGIHYTASIVDKSVVISTDAGSLTAVGNQLQILDDRGNLVAGLPLTYRKNNADYPIAAQISARSVTLTPNTEPAAGTPAPDVPHEGSLSQSDALRQVAASYPTPEARDAAALGTFVQQVTVASIAGAMIGTIVGGGIGCVGGLVVGGVATAPVAWLLGAGPLAGCIGGGVLLAPVGTVVGTIAVGGPILAVALFQYFQTMAAPIVPAPGA